MENIKSWFTYVNDNWEFIFEEIVNTAQMVLIVIAAATVTSVLLGVFIQRRPVARAVVLALSGIVLTIPSLALFALFIPVVGIGNPPAMLALYLYALMPVLRNTVTGLDSVEPGGRRVRQGHGDGHHAAAAPGEAAARLAGDHGRRPDLQPDDRGHRRHRHPGRWRRARDLHPGRA